MAMVTGDRMAVIEVMGVCNAAAHQTHYSVKTSYGAMSSTIQRITRQGGKILKVTVSGSISESSSSPAEQSIPAEAEAVVEPQKKGFKSKKK